MENPLDRRNRNMRTWLLARSAELREDVRDARLAFPAGDLRRRAAEVNAYDELDYIGRALESLDTHAEGQ